MSTKTKAPLVTSVNLKPSEDELMAVSDLYYTIDTLITMDGFTNENIMKKKGQTVLFWDWTIVTVGTKRIPAPIHTSSEGMSILFRWNDEPIELTNTECAYVTAHYYLDMLYRIERDWHQVSRRISPFAVTLINDGVKWMHRLPAVERQNIMYALKSQFTEKGHIILG